MKAAGYVHVVKDDGTTQVFAPGDTIPKALQDRVSNPAAVEGDDAEAFEHPVSRRGEGRGAGAPPPDDGLAEKSVSDLRDLASEREIEGRSTMDKGELIEALRAPRG